MYLHIHDYFKDGQILLNILLYNCFEISTKGVQRIGSKWKVKNIKDEQYIWEQIQSNSRDLWFLHWTKKNVAFLKLTM